MSTSQKPTILVIVGPTASGKSDLAVKLAKKCNGEVISADSRQVYRGLNIGTGKITKTEMKGVKHHLLDVADPKKQFTVIQYRKFAREAIEDILKRGKLPIICGGTGFYIDAVIGGRDFPAIGANKRLRAELAGKSDDELFALLEKLDPEAAAIKAKNNSERHNIRRLIRAIEIASALQSEQEKGRRSPMPSKSAEANNEAALPSGLQYDAKWIGIQLSREELKARIHARLVSRLKSGMITETMRLHSKGLSWKRMEELGLEYRYMARFLQGKMSRQEMIAKLEVEIGRYSKRQMTWWKRNPTIKWLSRDELSTSGLDFIS